MLAFMAFAGAAPGARPSDEMLVSFDVREASIQDVVGVLAEVGGLQVVIDPGVSCQLTLRLTQVPWPTVLDVALKSCRLGREDDRGILRIAPVARLTEEAAAQARLRDEQELARPRTTRRIRLSYARAEEVAPTIRKLLSARGEVIVDKRTNTLIISD